MLRGLCFPPTLKSQQFFKLPLGTKHEFANILSNIFMFVKQFSKIGPESLHPALVLFFGFRNEDSGFRDHDFQNLHEKLCRLMASKAKEEPVSAISAKLIKIKSSVLRARVPNDAREVLNK